MANRGVTERGLSVPATIAWPIVAMGLFALLWVAYQFGQRTVPATLVSQGPRIEEVRQIAKLAVLRVQVADVIEGNTAGAKAAVLVKGDADITVDFDRIQILDKDENSRTATVVLPSPRPDRARVDHDRTKIYELRKTGIAAINPFADPRAQLLADAMRAAQKSVEEAVQAAEFVARAREQAEHLLESFYRELGWTVRVQWQ